jgi:hypothetical protein
MVTARAELVMMLNLLRSALGESGARLHAGYIAEREAHLALQAGEGSVSAIIGRFQHEYARRFNRIHQEHGSLFRLHHHLLLFQHRRWLIPLVRFIHEMYRLEAPADAEGDLWWSSDAAYRGSAKPGWVTTNVVLRMLVRGAYNRSAQENAYRALFDQARNPSHTRWFTRGSAEDPRILGDAEFVTEVWRLTGRGPPHRGGRLHPLDEDISPIVMQVIERFNTLCGERLPERRAGAWRRLVTYENARSGSRRRPLPMVRALCVSCLVDHEIATAAQAARFFGCSPRSVAATRRRFYGKLFCEWFGNAPGILFGAGRTANRCAGEPTILIRGELAAMTG